MIDELGDVVLVPFPFTDQTASKKRPAVVVNCATYAHEHSDVIVLAVTSLTTTTNLRFGEAPVTNWSQPGFLKPSVFKPLLATLAQRLVVHRLGRLTSIRPANLAWFA